MKKNNKKFAVAVALILAVGAIVAALPVLVEAAVNVSTSGGQPMWFPELTNNTGGQYVNATSGLVTITNNEDTINGNKTDQVAGNKWIEVFYYNDATNGISIANDSSLSSTMWVTAMTVYASIDGGSTWHNCGSDTKGSSEYGNMTVSITDSDFAYTLTSSDTMDIKLELQFDTSSADSCDTYSTENIWDTTGETPGYRIEGYA